MSSTNQGTNDGMVTTDAKKVCTACSEEKPLSGFYTCKTAEDGYTEKCRTCVIKEKKDKTPKQVVETKICEDCEKEKPIDEFPTRAALKDGHTKVCKECTKIRYGGRQQNIDRKEDSMYTCSSCKEDKLGSEFYKGKDHICKACRSKKSSANRLNADFDKVFLNLLSSATANSQKRSGEAKICDITVQDIKEIYEQQNGRCYYSNIELTTKGAFKVSLERIDVKKGYIKTNIVLCCIEFNGQIQWTKEKVTEMLDILDKKITENLVDFNKKTTKDRTKDTAYDKDDYYNSPRGKMSAFCSTTKQRATRKSANGRKLEFDLDMEFLIDMFMKQKGLCAYSGLPLKFGNSYMDKWIISLERIDVTKGYTKDNVCFICVEFNTTDHTVDMIVKPETSTGWSKEKFKVIEDAIREYLGRA